MSKSTIAHVQRPDQAFEGILFIRLMKDKFFPRKGRSSSSDSPQVFIILSAGGKSANRNGCRRGSPTNLCLIVFDEACGILSKS